MAVLYYKLSPADVAKLYYSRTPQDYIAVFDQTGGHGDFYRGLYVMMILIVLSFHI